MNLAELPLKDLKSMADERGLHYHPNIGAVKLAEKLEALEPVSDEGDTTPEMVYAENLVVEEPQGEAVKADTKPHTATQTGVLPDPQARKFLELCTPDKVKTALEVHIRRGLQIVTMTDEFWHIRFRKSEDSGNMKIPLKQLVMCANVLLSTSQAEPTEGMDMEDILLMKRAQIR